jgi:hypothetical protein
LKSRPTTRTTFAPAQLERALPAGAAPQDAAAFLEGALHIEVAAQLDTHSLAWKRPLRFAPEQLRALGSCAAWHPAMFRQMGATSAGVRLALETDAAHVWVELAVDELPPASRAQLELAGIEGRPYVAGGAPAQAAPYARKNLEVDTCVAQGGEPAREAAPESTALVEAGDAVCVTVDGVTTFAAMPAPGVWVLAISCEPLPPGEAQSEQEAPATPARPLSRVTVELPLLRGVKLRGLVHDGTCARPLPQAPTLLCLGDSITQGFIAGTPLAAWPRLLAQATGMRLVNQGVGGQVFQATSLAGLSQALAVPPAAIWVCLGANYRFSKCDAYRTSQEIERYFAVLAHTFPGVRTYVATPFYHDERAYPTHAGSCFSEVAGMIARAVARHAQMELVDGQALLDATPKLYADADHPNAAGNKQLASRARRVMQGLTPKPAPRKPRPQTSAPPSVAAPAAAAEVVSQASERSSRAAASQSAAAEKPSEADGVHPAPVALPTLHAELAPAVAVSSVPAALPSSAAPAALPAPEVATPAAPAPKKKRASRAKRAGASSPEDAGMVPLPLDFGPW